MNIALDERGNPILTRAHLAASSSTGSSITVDPEQTSTTTPISVNLLEQARRRDAVRDAAREFEELSEQDLRERLRHATTRPLTAAEIAGFRNDVRAQVLDDLVDALDQNRRGKRRSRRTVRVVAPRGYIVKMKRGLSAEERDEVESRLRARGWTDQDVVDVLGIKAAGPRPTTPDPGVAQS